MEDLELSDEDRAAVVAGNAGITTFQHKAIPRFAVGPFEFKDGMLKVKDADLENWYNHLEGLPQFDRNQIVELSGVVTEKFAKRRGIRGAMGTKDIPDAVKHEAANPLAGKAEEIKPATGGLSDLLKK